MPWLIDSKLKINVQDDGSWMGRLVCSGWEREKDEKFKQSELEGCSVGVIAREGKEDAHTMQRVLWLTDWELSSYLLHTLPSVRLSSPKIFLLQRRFSDKNIHKPIPMPQQSHCLPLFSVVCWRGLFLGFLSLKNYFVNFTLEMERLGGEGAGGGMNINKALISVKDLFIVPSSPS